MYLRTVDPIPPLPLTVWYVDVCMYVCTCVECQDILFSFGDAIYGIHDVTEQWNVVVWVNKDLCLHMVCATRCAACERLCVCTPLF